MHNMKTIIKLDDTYGGLNCQRSKLNIGMNYQRGVDKDGNNLVSGLSEQAQYNMNMLHLHDHQLKGDVSTMFGYTSLQRNKNRRMKNQKGNNMDLLKKFRYNFHYWLKNCY